jgi:CheY-like chemotaxis protein
VPHRLLLADDSVTIQRVIELTFADEDVQVVAVSNGDQAMARLDAEPPDIVLADVGMPGKNGYELAAYIKHTPRLAHIPIVLLTGASEPLDAARMNGVACDGVLAKPFEPQLVVGRVKELLARRGGQAPAAQPSPARSPNVTIVGPSTPEELDGYFDRLDAAFANISAGKNSSTAPPDLPLSYASAKPQFDRPAAPESAVAPQTAARSPSVASPSSSAASAPSSAPSATKSALPPLADAFAAILAAEQAAPGSAAAAWPSSVTVGAAVTEDLIEQVTRRVLERLSDRVVRETVAEIVAAVSERLVKEEIDRLKNGGK